MNKLEESRLILGTGVSASKEYEELKSIVESCVQGGIKAFDTAPSYGTERLLGEILVNLEREKMLKRSECWIQTKVDPWQMQEKKGDISSYVESSIKNINTSYLDSILVHWPIPEYLERTLRSLEIIKESGMVNYIGICNVRKRHIEELISCGHKIDIVQIERHPLRNCNEDISFFKSQGIVVQAYSPLCKMNKKIQDNKILQLLADRYECNIGQLIMRWHMDTGVVPIFTTKKISRVREYSKIYEFMLQLEDIELINEVNENYKLYLESWLCPGY